MRQNQAADEQTERHDGPDRDRASRQMRPEAQVDEQVLVTLQYIHGARSSIGKQRTHSVLFHPIESFLGMREQSYSLMVIR